MYQFFVEPSQIYDKAVIITGPDVNHIKNVLRMKTGEEFLVSYGGISSLCRLDSFEGEAAVAEIIEENYQSTDLPIEIYLFQGLPKADKMELIIQKCVELGVDEIYPVEMKHCVVKLDDKKKKAKTQRWQAISESAAKQSKRTVIPEVFDAMPYKKAVDMASELDMLIVPYESKNGMAETIEVLADLGKCKSVGIIIGPEGGFD